MTTERDLYQAVLDAPDDDAPRLIFADWLEENGQVDRAEFIRTQIEMEQYHELTPEWIRLFRRSEKLLKGNVRKWSPKLPGWMRSPVFRRGFIEGVALTPTRFLEQGKECFDLCPLRWILVESRGPAKHHATEVFGCPELSRLNELSIRTDGMSANPRKDLRDGEYTQSLVHLEEEFANELEEVFAKYPGVDPHDCPDHFSELLKPGLFPNLVTLVSRCSTSYENNGKLSVLANNPLANQLIRLRCSVICQDDIKFLAQSSSFAKLHFLELEASWFGHSEEREQLLEELLRSGVVSRLRAFSFHYSTSYLTEKELMLFAESPKLSRLEALALWDTPISPSTIEAILNSPHLTNLRWLGVNGEQLEKKHWRAMRERFGSEYASCPCFPDSSLFRPHLGKLQGPLSK